MLVLHVAKQTWPQKLTPVSQQAILAQCIYDLHHISCHICRADQAANVLGRFCAGISKELSSCPVLAHSLVI